MKCPHCGGEVTLEQRFCPYCGKPNEQARRHVEDMKRFQASYEATEAELRQKTTRFTGTMVRIVVLAVLVVMIIVTFLIGSNYYSIKYDRQQAEANKKFAEYSQLMDTYLADRNYLELAEFTDAKHIRAYDTAYEGYGELLWAASSYAQAYRYLMDIVACDRLSGSHVEYLSSTLVSFYRYGDDHYWEDKEKGRYEQYLEMQAELEDLLGYYLGLTDDQVAGLHKLSESRLGVLIEDQARLYYPEAFEEAE